MTTNDEIIRKGQSKKVIAGGNVFYDNMIPILNEMLNEARSDTTTKLKDKIRMIMHAFSVDSDKSFKHIDEILETIEVD